VQAATVAAAGFPSFIAGSVRGEAAKAPASERLTLGFIGTGKQAQAHLGALAGNRGCEVLAVCDVDTTRREAARKFVEEKNKALGRQSSVVGCIDFMDVIRRKDIDAVVISTPDHWHAIPIIEACKAGKDIYCEKPLTLTLHEASLVKQAVRRYGRVLQTGSQQRSEWKFRVACELVRSGRIGKIKEVVVNVGSSSKPCDLPEETMEPGLDWERWLGPAPVRPYNSVLSPRGVHNHYPNWRNYREYSGGMMTDWGAHHFDITQWGLGMDGSGPNRITPPQDPKADRGVVYHYDKTPVGDNVAVVHAVGAHTFTTEKGEKLTCGVTFKGESGIIGCDRGRLHSDPIDIVASLDPKDPSKGLSVQLYDSRNHHQDWLDCIRTRKDPICSVDVGAGSVAVCHLGNLAYWNRRPLKWDPVKWEFPGDAEADGWRDRERRAAYQLPTL
jgi:predicted dehydrogenase